MTDANRTGAAETETDKKMMRAVSLRTDHTGASAKVDELGMRPMQQQVYRRRGAQYLLIKSPPASGKSRALMFVALDKLHNQGMKKAYIVVPERSIGGSFTDEALSKHGFWADWAVEPRWNLCNAPGVDDGPVARSKVKAVKEFAESESRILICTHATFRFAMKEYGAELFDGSLVAIDEFHHVSANPDNQLGVQLDQLIGREKTHIIAMTGSYFRGDSDAVLSRENEQKFETVTYTYYQQLNGYQWLKELDINYYFYDGNYLDAIADVLDPSIKTIVHIPNINSRESTKNKHSEVNILFEHLGTWQGLDEATGFDLIRRESDGRILRVANLVDDTPAKRSRVIEALKDPAQRHNRDHVDIIIALGMAKEGFDWIWCERALTVGQRSSMTEMVQIIGRATRDAPGKTRAEFLNLIAEPDASQENVTAAVNDFLKAISASLLMEQVMAPRFEFLPKKPDSKPKEGFDYGEHDYDPKRTNIGFNNETGELSIEVDGFAMSKTEAGKRACSEENLQELMRKFTQDRRAMERAIFEKHMPAKMKQDLIQQFVQNEHPELEKEDIEAITQRGQLVLTLMQEGQKKAREEAEKPDGKGGGTAFIDGVRRFAMNVKDLNIDLIRTINPFQEAYNVLSKSMNAGLLQQIERVIMAQKSPMSYEEAQVYAMEAHRFQQEHGRPPEARSSDLHERKMAEGVAVFWREYNKREAEKTQQDNPDEGA